MASALPICTVGHSTRTIEQFVDLLRVGPADREQESRTAELNTLRKYLATLHVDTPAAVRQQLLLRIATLERELAE